MDENMAADVLTGTDASAESADFDGLFDMDGGEVTAEPQETEGQEGAAQAQEPEADPAEGTCADAQPGRQEQPGAEPKYKVKFYGQEQEMTVSELVAAAQRAWITTTCARGWSRRSRARPPCSWWSGTPRPTA